VSTATTLAADDTEEEEAGDTEGEDFEGTTAGAAAAVGGVIRAAAAGAVAVGQEVVLDVGEKCQRSLMLEEGLMSPLLVGVGVEDQEGREEEEDEDEEEAGEGGKRKRVEGDQAQKKRKGLPLSASAGLARSELQQQEQQEEEQDGDVKMAPVSSSSSPSHNQSNPHQQLAVSVGDSNVRVLYARSVILAEKSQYFDRAFRRGGFREMGERQLELSFDDEEGFDDFARLIRLCHGPSFTSEAATSSGSGGGGEGRRRELRREELLRLVLVADAFEVVQCVEEGVTALCARMSYTLAVKTFQRVPEGLRNHGAIHKLLLAAGAALAKGVGVLGGTKIWSRRRPDVMRGGKDKYVRFLPDLQGRLLQLPLMAVDFLVRSPGLRLTSENDAFAFVCAWLKGQQGGGGEGEGGVRVKRNGHLIR